MLELELNCSTEYQKILLPLLSSTCSHASTHVQHGIKEKRMIVPHRARCKTVQVDVKLPQLLISVKAKSALLRHWMRQKKEDDVLKAFKKKLCTYDSFLLLWMGCDTGGISW